MKFHLHNYGKWSVPLQDYDGYKRQYRCCETCGIVTERRFWDSQVALSKIYEVLGLKEQKQ